MTKIKKTLALVMVLVMAMTTLVLPVAAVAPQEEVAPCAAESTCLNCGELSMRQYYVNKTETVYVTCGACSYAHKHTRVNRYLDSACSNCGYYKTTFVVRISDKCNHSTTV